MMKPKLLNLGCGKFIHEDWINIDFISTRKEIVAHNLLLGIPSPDNEFDMVYHSHVLEHFPKDKAGEFLAECFRVLKPNGIIRVAVPDLEGIVKEYLKWLEGALQGNDRAESNYDWIMLELYDQTVRNYSGGEMVKYLTSPTIVNDGYVRERIGADIQEVYQHRKIPAQFLKKFLASKTKLLFRKFLGKHFDFYVIGKYRMSGEIHQWMYDRFSLSRLLRQAGFQKIEIKTACESNFIKFAQYGLDTYRGMPRGSSSIFIEAFKVPL
jgi:predicted SAM-dependent methyltransferase